MPGNTPPDAFRFRNKVLTTLPAEVVQRLHLRTIDLPANRVIESSGEVIDNLFFLETGAASMTTTFDDGSQVEVGLFGYEHVLGASALMGTRRSLNRVYMQIGGHGFAASMAAARAEFRLCGLFQQLVFRGVQAQLCQVAQSAGCNAKHDVEQRLARWLLLCADRVGSESLFISQEFLSTMLGVRRMSAVLSVGRFKDLGLIDHHRGHIQILDPIGLEAKACECYRIVKQHLDNATEFESGFAQQ